MKVRLDFLDANDELPKHVNKERYIYDGLPPTPNGGDIFYLEGQFYVAKTITVYYFAPSEIEDWKSRGTDQEDIKISISCVLIERK